MAPLRDDSDIEPVIDDVPTRTSPTQELGVTGLRRSVGTVDEEFLPQLKGRRGIQIFREMRENSPIVGALVYSIDRLLRQVEFNVVPAEGPGGKADAEFLEEVRDDMSHPFDEFISEALTCITYGWAFHEIVYKRREGPDQKDPTRRSKYSDGKIGIRKMPLRAQETLLRWVFDSDGGIQAMVQLAPPRYQTAVIPIHKALLIRTMSVKNNPEGYSLLRNAYRPWFMMKRAEEYEMIGVERDLAGMPVFKVPREYLAAGKNTPEGKLVDGMRRAVRNMRRDEQEGLIIPTQLDENGNDEFGFELLGGGGTRQFNTDQIIRRYAEQILMSVLADFIMLGQAGGSGSYAMHTDKQGLFRAGINSISQSIADTLNQHLVPRLFQLNGSTSKELPRFEPSNIDPPDLGQLASLVSAMSGAGMNFFPDPQMDDFIRDAARLPKLDEKDKSARDLEAQQADLLRMAQGRMELIQIRQQAMQGAAAAVDAANPAAQDPTQPVPPGASMAWPPPPGTQPQQQAEPQIGEPEAEAPEPQIGDAVTPKAPLPKPVAKAFSDQLPDPYAVASGAQEVAAGLPSASSVGTLARASQRAQAAANKRKALAKKPRIVRYPQGGPQ